MTVLIILGVLSIIGIGASFWLLKSEQDSEGVSIINKAEPLESAILHSLSEPEKQPAFGPQQTVEEEPKPGPLTGLFNSLKEKLAKTKKEDAFEPKESSGLIRKFLAKLPFGKQDNASDDIADVSHLPSLADQILENSKKPQTGTASITTATLEEKPVDEKPLSPEEEKNIENEINLSARLNELEEKYKKLDAMFGEKSAELEETKKTLENELRTRKEFNKVKDILEKEIKDLKDKARGVQVERDNAKMESENYQKNLAQLKERVLRLEKNLLEKDDKINELVKRLQTFASPSTTSTPPSSETPPADLEESSPAAPPETPSEVSAPAAPIEETASPEPLPQTEEAQKETEEAPGPEEPPLSQDPQKTEEEEEGPSPENLPEEEPPSIGEPPEPDPQQEDSDGPAEEKEFLTLRPDVLSAPPNQNSPIADEIEHSLEPEKPPVLSETDEAPSEEENAMPQDPADENNTNNDTNKE